MKKGQNNQSSFYCQQFGLRATKTREMLFECLGSAKKPLSVPELLELFVKQGSKLNKTTLYRELEHLVNLDILQKIQLSEERVSYEFTSGHHHHFICESCSAVTKLEFAENFVKKIEKMLVQEGNHVARHTFEFFGLCKKCSYI